MKRDKFIPNFLNNENNILKKKVKINNNDDNFKFNNVLYNSIKNKDLKLKKIETEKNIQSYENYEKSFNDIIEFHKFFTKKQLSDIDTIIYHSENNDGMFSAAIVYHYLKEFNKNKNKDILLIPEKPGKFTFKNKIFGKNIIILDLSLNTDFLNEIIKIVKSYIIIDDHSKTILNDQYIFNGNYHATCSYTWKFFYPKKDIPNSIIYVDNSDGKAFIPFIPKTFSTLFAQSTGIRLSHDKSSKALMKENTEILNDLWEMLIDDNKLKFLIYVGYYYHQVSESLKEQIAINAQPDKFQGFNVGVLNFNSPALSKPVCRQIITNFKNRNIPIDFALCWGYEYTAKCYRIQLIDDHNQKKIDMSEIAKKLGKIGGIEKSGGGHFHVGNFYWPHEKNGKDIWDLFKIQYL